MGEYRIPRSAVIHVLQGVTAAAETSLHAYDAAEQWARGATPHDETTPGSEGNIEDPLSLVEWCTSLQSSFQDQDESRHIAAVAIAVSFLRGCSREGRPIPGKDLDTAWGLVHDALSSQSPTAPAWKANRSSQGFLAVPLCSSIKDGNIDELFRLHVWLPDAARGNADFAIHSHQPFAQSWILAGDATDTSWGVEAVGDPAAATHAKYSLAWDDGKRAADNTYKTHQQSSTVVNTREFVRATAVASTVHSKDMSYAIPASSFHTTAVKADELHATLFFFDSHRGFVKDASVLGPKDVESSTQLRDPAGVSPSDLAAAADALRRWEALMASGRHHMRRADWEHALRDLNSALELCSPEGFPSRRLYESLVHGDLGNTYRRLGRYEQAVEYLRRALDGLPTGMPRVEISGELGVVYRHMSRLEDAKLAFEMQYFMARDAGFERAVCRAIGNMGMVNYQLFRRTGKGDYLSLATYNLTERVRLARRLQTSTGGLDRDQSIKEHWQEEARTWETIGLSRLSLCRAAAGDFGGAVAAAQEAAELTRTSKDSTVVAMSRLFYGLALLRDGRRDEAILEFNAKEGCTPAIALCKEPSGEHREYLGELIGAGADLDLVDEHGYTAVEYAVFNGDVEMERLVLEGLRQKHGMTEDALGQRRAEAVLRRGYRELFQEKLRPVLLRGGEGALQMLRTKYAAELAADGLKDGMFDALKFLRYSDLVGFGKLPRSSDSLTQVFAPGSTEFVIFISYRWLVKATLNNSPDDEENTQYNRVVAAVEEFLAPRPDVDRSKLSIWLVRAPSFPFSPSPASTSPHADHAPAGLRLHQAGRPRQGRQRPPHDPRAVQRRHQPRRRPLLHPRLVRPRGPPCADAAEVVRAAPVVRARARARRAVGAEARAGGPEDRAGGEEGDCAGRQGQDSVLGEAGGAVWACGVNVDLLNHDLYVSGRVSPALYAPYVYIRNWVWLGARERDEVISAVAGARGRGIVWKSAASWRRTPAPGTGRGDLRLQWIKGSSRRKGKRIC